MSVLRRTERERRQIRNAFAHYLSPAVVEDRSLSADIEAVALSISSGSLVAAVEAEIGELA